MQFLWFSDVGPTCEYGRDFVHESFYIFNTDACIVVLHALNYVLHLI